MQEKEPIKITEDIICQRLNSLFAGNCKYKVANAFIFKRDWESDFFVQKNNGYAYEFEVKITRADFNADRNKVQKHLILEKGMFVEQKRVYNPETTCYDDRFIKQSTEREHIFRPNKFFYVVPKGMITVDELPKYAGLYYFEEYVGNCSLTKVKDAPFIHKKVLDFESVLCNKFYARWNNLKVENRLLKQEVERLNSKLAGLDTSKSIITDNQLFGTILESDIKKLTNDNATRT